MERWCTARRSIWLHLPSLSASRNSLLSVTVLIKIDDSFTVCSVLAAAPYWPHTPLRHESLATGSTVIRELPNTAWLWNGNVTLLLLLLLLLQLLLLVRLQTQSLKKEKSLIQRIMMAYRGNGGIAPRILNPPPPNIRYKRKPSFPAVTLTGAITPDRLRLHGGKNRTHQEVQKNLYVMSTGGSKKSVRSEYRKRRV